MKIFLLKAKHFIKRNIYPITVTLCTVLMLGIITISAYSTIKSSRDDTRLTSVNKNENGEKGSEKGKETESGESTENNDDDKKTDDSKETSATETIIFDLPFEGATISKEYAEDKLIYDETTKYWCTHQALDFSCNEGQKVYAVYDGKITKIDSSMMNGTVVYLSVSENLTVVYKGLSSNIALKEGDIVKKGQEIGTVTSMLSEKADGVHLHFEVIKDEKLVDPTEYFSFNK